MKNFVVYRSSAGSGKTFTLVREFLRLALFDNQKLDYNYKRILAVTFTNKAAAEMKERVISALHDISTAENPPPIGNMLCDELKITAKELKRRAAVVLSSLLHHYSDLSIGTIDSFTHRIVKTFAHDLQLPVNFNIETDSKGFYEKVVSTLLAQVGEDEQVSRLLKEYVLLKAEDNASWDPEQQILGFSGLLQKEDAQHFTARLEGFSSDELESFRKQFLDFISYYRQQLREGAQHALQLIAEAGLSDDDFSYKSAGPQSFFKKCMDATVSLEQTRKGRLMDALTSGRWLAKDSPHQADFEAIRGQVETKATELLEFVGSHHSYYLLCEALSRQMYPLMLLKKIEEISREKKAEDKLVFISEFNSRIFDMVNNEPTPFIYERLGERYNHYLLDEFQDTSSLQWQNLLPLLDNALSGGWFNLLVGDGKQSIYRWRNANVKQFAALPAIENTKPNPVTEARADTLKRNFEERLLDTNYRSLPAIVEFNNQFFAAMTEKVLSPERSSIYRGHEQRVKADGQGYVSIDTSAIQKDQVDDYTCDQVRAHIAKAISSGFEYSDICVLVRNNHHGNTIASWLLENNTPVVSSDSLLLKNNTEINTVICYLNYLANRHDTVSAAAVLSYLYRNATLARDDYHRALRSLSSGEDLFSVLATCGIMLHADSLLLNNLFDHCVDIIKALRLNARAYHYLRFFLDEVNEFLVLKNSGLTAFLDWWTNRREKASMIIPSGTNAVKVMTIHASKGLEFPVVIIPYCNWPVYRSEESWVELKHDKVKLPVAVIPLSRSAADIGFSKEFETENEEQTLDNLNLLYVAFTRAVERLHIIAALSAKNNKPGVAGWIKEFAQGAWPGNSGPHYETGQLVSRQNPAREKGSQRLELRPLSFDTLPDTVRIKASWQGDSTESEEAKRLGINMHRVLAMIDSEADLESAMRKAQLEGLMAVDELPALRERLRNLLHHPQLHAYFSGQLITKREAELITASGQVLRPDRIVFVGETVVIIDYKTGRADHKRHSQQILSYQDALADLGHKNFKKLLVYLNDMQVVEVN